MFCWNAEMIRFLKDAAEYTHFYDTLAEKASRFLSVDTRICDAGCGLGYLSLALARTCAQVTAADVSGEALDVLREKQRISPLTNLHIWQGDIFSMPEDIRFDAMLFCFFGEIRNTLLCAKKHCNGKLIYFKKNWDAHRFTLNEKQLENYTLPISCNDLDELHIPYHVETFELEMGQPFRSVSDAAAFFRIYEKGDRQRDINERDVEGLLIPSDSEEFPYYLPSKGSVGIIVLDVKDIPDNLIYTEEKK